MEEGLAELRRRLGEIDDLDRARALLAWDERTQMPPGGAGPRADQLASLARIHHEHLTSAAIGDLLDGLAEWADSQPPDTDEASLIRVARREWEKARRVPAALRAEIAHAASLGEQAWARARADSDFASFLPHLEGMVELKRRYVECFAPFDHPYDPLLDDFERGMTTAELRPLLSDLRSGLVPLIGAIAEHADAVDDSCLYGEFEAGGQAELARRVVASLPIDEGEWRLDTTVHPFAAAIAPTDIRLTTRYEPGYVGTALWAVLHEAGHGMYENGIPPELARTPLGEGASLGFHESQSRLWENWVGRGRPYLSHVLPTLRDLFPRAFGGVDAEGLYRAANRVRPSLIRVEADEVTYNLHVILRFELELEIIEERVALRDLPEAWNSRMSELLGIEVPDDGRGVLQDVHWSGGAFGYFPTYSLGNLVAAAVWEGVREALPDLDQHIADGELQPLRDHLRESIHRHGAKHEPREMFERISGGPLTVAPLLDHLRRKFGEIYGL